jgi:hypothetical protein
MQFLNISMYKSVSQIENVTPSTFKINTNNNDLYINKDNVIEVFGSDNKREVINLLERSKVTMIINNEVWIADLLTGKTIFYNTNQKAVDFIATTFRDVNYFVHGKYVFAQTYFNGDFSKRFYTKINTQEKFIEEKYSECGFNGIYQILNEDLFLTQNNEKFAVFTFDNTCVWEIYFKDLFKEYESIGAGTTNIIHVSNKLFIELDKTYCINIETGKKENDFDVKLTTSESVFLYGFQFHNIEVIELTILNAKTNELRIINIEKEFKKHNVHPDQRIIVNQGLVYFSQNMGTHQAKVGVFDPEKCKILWLQVFEKENGMVGTIKVNGNRIYAHTQDNTIHIFEKTD